MSQKVIANSVDQVLSLIDSGTHPRKAIVKVASVNGLLPEQVNRLCQIYNRSTSLSSRLGNNDLSEKLATVTVIDPREIQKELSQKNLERSITSRQSKMASMTTLNRVLTQKTQTAVTEKVAESPQVIVDKKDKTHGIYHGMSFENAIKELDRLKAKHASIQEEGLALFVRCKNQITVLKDLISKKAAHPTNGVDFLNQVRHKIEQSYPTIQWVGDPVISYAVDSLPSFKRASIESEFATIPRIYGIDAKQIFVEFEKLAALVKDIDENAPALASTAADVRERYFLLKTHLTENGVKNSSFHFTDRNYADIQEEHISKVASMFGAMLGTQLNRMRQPPVPSSGANREDEFRLKLSNPQHEANLASIRTRTALQELMVDDPVISSANPEDVVAAYNELANYSPGALQNPAVMRAVLRQYLQNNASSFDLSEIQKLERAIPTQTRQQRLY